MTVELQGRGPGCRENRGARLLRAHGPCALGARPTDRRDVLYWQPLGRSEADGDNRYLPEKWSVKEVLGHIIDTERIMAYRALRIARGDKTPIEGFEQDDYVRNGPFGHCRLSDLVEEFMHVRRATVAMFRNLDEPAITRKGVANKHEVTARALAYIIAGHELHHRRIVEEKYFATTHRP